MTGSGRAEMFRRVVVAFKLATGSAELALGTAVLALSQAGFTDAVHRLLAREVREDPTGGALLFLHHRIPAVLADRRSIALVLLGLGGLKIAGAIGLLTRRPWAYYLLLGLVALLLPVDCAHVARRPSIVGGALLALNVAALGVLVGYRAQLLAGRPPDRLTRAEGRGASGGA